MEERYTGQKKDCVSVFVIIWCKERKFLHITITHLDLMVPLYCIKAGEVDKTRPITYAFDRRVTPTNREIEWVCDAVKTAKRHAHVPHKVGYIFNVLLMWLGSK